MLMAKKIVFVSCMNFSDSTAGAARIRVYCKMLLNEGVDTQFYSIFDFYKTKPLIKKLIKYKYVRRLSYIARVFLYTLSINKIAKSEPDTVFYLYPTTQVLLDYLLVMQLKLLTRRRIFLEVNEVRKYGSSVKKNSFGYLKFLLHEKTSRYFDGLICISTNIEEYYTKYNKNTLLLPILSDTSTAYKCHCNYQVGRPFNIGFTGSVHIKKENLEVFFISLAQLCNKGYSIKLNLYGIIYEEEEFYSLISKYNLKDVIRFQGKVEHELIPNVLSQQDLLVLPRAGSDQNKYGFSTKLAEYLVSGVPVLITDVSDNLLYLTPGVDCLLARFDSPDSFSNQIESLIINYNSTARLLALNAFNTASDRFYWLSHSERLLEFLIQSE